LITSIGGFSQVNFDSLNQVWVDETQPDSSRFEALLDIAWNGYLLANPDTAYKIANQLFTLAKQKRNKKWQAGALTIQGASFYLKGNFEEAINHFNKSLAIKNEIGDQKGVAASLNTIGKIYKRQGKVEEAESYGEKSLKLAQEIKAPNQIKNAASSLKKIYKSKKEDLLALEMYELEVLMLDKLKNEELAKLKTKMQTEVELEKAELQKENDDLNNQIKSLKAKLNYLFWGFGVLIFMVFGLILKLRNK